MPRLDATSTAIRPRLFSTHRPVLTVFVLSALFLVPAAQAVDNLTLAQKADLFEHDLSTRFDLDGQILCKLKLPTSARTFVAYNMPDNAYMTGIHLATLSMKYAVTKDESDRKAARRSLDALHLLATVSGVPGLLARSAWPADRPFDDDGIWRESPDGKYRWRGDVSSDQMDGVLYGLSVAYDLVADEAQRARIAKDVAALVDHVLEHDLRIVGFDGKPTQWGSYYPEYVQTREPMNALLWLQHLKVAEHVTGEARFADAYRRYAVDMRYAQTAERARAMRDPLRKGAVNHSDDVLLFLAYYPLLAYETDRELHLMYVNSLHRTWRGNGRFTGVKPEANPFYAFIVRQFLEDDSGVGPGIDTLERFPLDMKWNRETIAGYETHFSFQTAELSNTAPGDSAVVPIDQRRKSWSAWVMDPYHSAGSRQADIGMEFNGHDFLMAYWLGRYLGLIDER